MAAVVATTEIFKLARQALFTQKGVAAPHSVPHAPQLSGSSVTSCSHPSATLLLQLPKPAAQRMAHVPPLQDGVPLLPLHTFLHEPQLLISVLTGSSQPSTWLGLQLSQPV